MIMHNSLSVSVSVEDEKIGSESQRNTDILGIESTVSVAVDYHRKSNMISVLRYEVVNVHLYKKCDIVMILSSRVIDRILPLTV